MHEGKSVLERFTTAVVPVLCLAVGFAPSLAQAGDALPFRASYSINSALTPTGPAELQVHSTGVGVGRHLGQSLYTGDESADFYSNPGSVTVRGGQMIIVAANGDQLYGTYQALGTLPDEAGNLTFHGTFTITGGTGRFAGASGGGTTAVQANLYTGSGTLTLEGTLVKTN